MIAHRPRRLTPPAAPGTLLKRFDRAAETRKVDQPDYIAQIQQLPCLYCGVEPCGEAAHVSYSNAVFEKKNSLGKRAKDCDAVPLCRDDHLNARHAQHKGGEEAFWLALGIDPYAVAKRLYEQRDDLVAMRAVVMVAIANRTKR